MNLVGLRDENYPFAFLISLFEIMLATSIIVVGLYNIAITISIF